MHIVENLLYSEMLCMSECLCACLEKLWLDLSSLKVIFEIQQRKNKGVYMNNCGVATTAATSLGNLLFIYSFRFITNHTDLNNKTHIYKAITMLDKA